MTPISLLAMVCRTLVRSIGIGPAKLTAKVGRARIIGQQLGLLTEIFAGTDLCERFIKSLFRRCVIDDLVWHNQDVARIDLLDFAALIGAAQVVDFNDVEAAGGTNGGRDIAFVEILQHVGKQRRNLLSLHPAKRATFERRRTCRVANGHLAKIGTVLNLGVHLVGEIFDFLSLVSTGAFRHREAGCGTAHIPS